MGREVIADIDFDNTGSVRLRGLEGDLGGLQSQTEKTANVFTHRMFNMRTAAMAFLGSFTLAGVIFGLKNLAEEVIKSSSKFGELSNAGDRLQATFFGLARETFNVSEGIEKAVTWTDRFNALMIAAGQAQEAAGEGKTGIVLKWLFGHTSIGNVLETLNKTQEIVGKIIDKVLPAQLAEAKNPLFDPKRVEQWEEAVTKALAALPGPGGATGNLTFGDLSGVDASGNSVFIRSIEKATRATGEFRDVLFEAIPVFSEAAAAIDPFVLAAENWDRIVKERSDVREWADDMAALTERAREATVQFQMMQFTIQSGAELIANALAGNVTSYRLFIRSVLIELAKMLVVEGIGNLAKGFAASATPFGAAIAHFYFRAAALDFAGAALAGGAARAVGGGAGGGVNPNRSPGLGPGFPTQGGGMTQNITVIVEGNATEDTVDSIIDAISVRLKDGVSGGNFNGQLVRTYGQ